MKRFQVNMNGDTHRTLTEQHLAVERAAGELLRLMRLAAPHGRNYQHEQAAYEVSDLKADLDEYQVRCAAVEVIRSEYMEAAMRAHDQAK